MAHALCAALVLLTAISLALTLWRWLLHLRFPLHQRGKIRPQPAAPGVTILKPLKGCDAETKACLRSWFEQEGLSARQILFGVAAADDPVCAVVRELLSDFPKADAELVICPKQLGANAKVSTLQQLEPLIKHPLVIISDADTRVPRDFTAQVTSRCGVNVGLVNCFYRLANPSTLAMQWEAIAINADFWTSVLQATSLKPMDFALGAVMTLPAAELRAIGGFASLANCLADDYQLGHRIAALGRRIELAPVVADCWEAPSGWGHVWRHQLRWARTIRVCQPVPFFFSVLNNGGIAATGLLVAGALGRWPVWTLAFAVATLVFRMASARQQQARMSQRTVPLRYIWLVPVKDLLDFFMWAAAFWGGEVEWRGERYHVGRGGELRRI